jgi:hypothetical protein
MNSIQDREDLKKKYKYEAVIEENNTALDINYSIVKYQPIKHNFGSLTIAMNIDPKV